MVSDRCSGLLGSSFSTLQGLSVQLPDCLILAYSGCDSVIYFFYLFHCTSLHRPASSAADQCTHGCTRQRSRRHAGVRTETTAAAAHGSNAVKCLICSRILREQARCRVFCCCHFCAPFSWAAERQQRRPQREELNTASRCSLSPIRYSLVENPQCNSTVMLRTEKRKE